MVKTAPLYDDTHMQVKEVQMALLKKYRRQLSVADIMSYVFKIIKDPMEVAKKIMEIRNNEYKEIHGSEESNKEIGLDAVDSDKNDGDDFPKSSGVVLIKEEDVISRKLLQNIKDKN